MMDERGYLQLGLNYLLFIVGAFFGRYLYEGWIDILLVSSFLMALFLVFRLLVEEEDEKE